MERKKSLLALIAGCAIVLALLASCSLGTGPGLKNDSITIRIADNMAKTVLPTGSMDAHHYAVHGAGTAGQANGSSFDLTLTPAAPSASVDLLPGTWSVVVTVWNTDTPSVAVGSGSKIFVAVVGTAQTVSIPCQPNLGNGNLAANISWVPNIISIPQIEVDMKPFSGAIVPITMSAPGGGTSSSGTASLPAGWYTGAMRLKDNGVLSAGIVRTVRMAQDFTTTWSEFLTVSALQGAITIDTSYNPGPPLALSANIPSGEIPVYTAGTVELTLNEPAHDPATGVAYAFFLNGVLTALSATASLTLDGDDFAENARYYLSATALQSDGARAGDMQWIVVRGTVIPETSLIGGTVTNIGAYALRVDLIASDGTTVLQTFLGNEACVTLASLGYAMPSIVADGSYYLRAETLDGGYSGDVILTKWYGGTGSAKPASANVGIPHAPLQQFNIAF